MTDQNLNNQSGGASVQQNKPTTPKFSGLSGWLGALMGKPMSSKVPTIPQAQKAPQPVSENTNQPVSSDIATGNEDSVKQDVEKFKSVVGKITGEIGSKVAPVLKEGIGDTSKVATSVVSKIDKKYVNLILKIFAAIIGVIILIYAASRLISSLEPKEEETQIPGATRDNTPTPVFYNPPKSSIYASEQYILSLEEEINILTQEITTTVLRESNLNPPSLDYTIDLE